MDIDITKIAIQKLKDIQPLDSSNNYTNGFNDCLRIVRNIIKEIPNK